MGDASEIKGGEGLETFFAVRCGDGDTAVPDGS